MSQEEYNKEYYQKNKKSCQERMRKYYIKNREKIKEQSRKWAADHPEEVKARNKKWRENKEKRNAYERQRNFIRRREDPAFREYMKIKRRESYQRHKAKRLAEQLANRLPEVHASRARVHYAIKSGKIQKPQCCSSCNSSGLLHAHHNDYSKPLEVVWLCPLCHGETHI